jgi:hypothetical protein
VPDIIDKPIRAGELPPGLRGDLDPSSLVLVTVRRVTSNGFTVAEEAAILEAEAEAADTPFRPSQEVLAEIRAIIDEH